MWKKIVTSLKEKSCPFFPFSIMLYISFTHIIPRTNYAFLKEKHPQMLNPTTFTTLETRYKLKIRKKIIQDFTKHKIRENRNAHSITKVIINNEGKIIGYKIYKAFYPNYFTKTQIKNMLKKVTKFINQNSNLHIIKITFSIQ
jgi:hypothetical protein